MNSDKVSPVVPQISESITISGPKFFADEAAEAGLVGTFSTPQSPAMGAVDNRWWRLLRRLPVQDSGLLRGEGGFCDVSIGVASGWTGGCSVFLGFWKEITDFTGALAPTWNITRWYPVIRRRGEGEFEEKNRRIIANFDDEAAKKETDRNDSYIGLWVIIPSLQEIIGSGIVIPVGMGRLVTAQALNLPTGKQATLAWFSSQFP